MRKPLAQIILRLARYVMPAPAMALGLLSSLAHGGTGDLDPTFGQGGRVSLDLGLQPAPSCSVIQQADGKLVIATTIYDTTNAQRVLARLDKNGTLDATFGSGSLVIGTQLDEEAAVVIQQSDGKLVVAGNAWSNGYDAVLWRFDSRGRADTSFGIRGSVHLDLGGSESASRLIQQANGKLVIAGTEISDDGDERLLFARFTQEGNLDTAFGSVGTVLVDFPDRDSWETTALIQQPDGKLLATGHRNGRVVVVRITPDGVLDETFGVDGIAEVAAGTMNPAHDSTWGGSAALQDDGRIVIVGNVGHTVLDVWDYVVISDGFALRLESSGALDRTFGKSGILTNERANFASVAIEGDAKIVAVFDDFVHIGLMRFNRNGSTDVSFGAGGTAIADFGSLDRSLIYVADEITRQTDGKLIVVGSHAEVGGDRWTLGLARFDAHDAGFPGLIGLTSAAASVEEGRAVTFTVRRTGGSTGAVSVAFETTDGTATAGSDYTPQLGRLDWDDRDTSDKTITLASTDDISDESMAAEQFGLRLADPTGGAMLTTSAATISIADNDQSSASPPPPPPPSSPTSPTSPQGYGGGCSDALLLGFLLIGLSRKRSK